MWNNKNLSQREFCFALKRIHMREAPSLYLWSFTLKGKPWRNLDKISSQIEKSCTEVWHFSGSLPEIAHVKHKILRYIWSQWYRKIYLFFHCALSQSALLMQIKIIKNKVCRRKKNIYKAVNWTLGFFGNSFV